MTKRQVVKKAWEIATGRSPYTIATVFRVGRGWGIDSVMSSSTLGLHRPMDENGMPEYEVIRYEGPWDTEPHQATQKEIAEFLFDDFSPL